MGENCCDHFTDYSSYPISLVPIIKTSDSEEGVICRRGERDSEDSSQLRQQVTIGALPDDVLLNIFKLFVDATSFSDDNEWHTLVHVCRRWRNLAFTFPHHLNLELFYRPHRRSVKETLDIWPELPLYIDHRDYQTKEVRDNVVAALGLNHRLTGIRLELSPDFSWEVLEPLMPLSFPVLKSLICSWFGPIFSTKTIPRSFLGRSAPSLRHLYLNNVTFPALPELLLSATNLVCLSYNNIPWSGYISPQTMVTSLSALTRLETLSLMFQSPQPPPDRAIRIPPLHTGTLLPALSYLCFQGDLEYLEYLVAQIHDPLLKSMDITFFHQEVLEISEFAKFVRRADKLSLVDRAEVTYNGDRISVTLSEVSLIGRVDPKALLLNFKYPEWNLQFSYLAHFCSSCLPTLSAFESLHIRNISHYPWQDVVDHPNPQFLDLLRLFNTVMDLHPSGDVAPRIAQALRGLPMEQVAEVLPALENFIVPVPYRDYVQSAKEAIYEFIEARRLSGHPVSLRFTVS